MKKHKIIKYCLMITLFSAIISLALIFAGCFEYGHNDDPIIIKVTYIAAEGGKIEGKTVQEIEYGKDSETVVAVPDEGYEFVEWSDWVLSPARNETAVQKDIEVTAVFKKKELMVEYSGINGCVEVNGENVGSGGRRYFIQYGEDIGKVKAVVSDLRYVFLEWSDGIKTPERTDMNITENLHITAIFGINITYGVDEGIGGKIIGKTSQVIEEGKQTEPVKAVADEGYVFVGWSDLSIREERTEYNVERSFEYIAYFEPLQKDFQYDYNGGSSMLETNVTVTRENIGTVRFTVPERQGYTFCGWYADKDYRIKVANDKGRYMLGYYGLTLESDKVYARWKNNNDDRVYYHTLLVFTDEVRATLYSSKSKQDEIIDYKMTGLERKSYPLFARDMYNYLNEWFEGEVLFEVDMYFTTQTLKEDCFERGMASGDRLVYFMTGKFIPEINNDINKDYRSILTFVGMNDPDCLLRDSAGSAYGKYGTIHIEDIWGSSIINKEPLQMYYENIKNHIDENGINAVSVTMHEFIHTIECKYNYYDIYEFHSWIGNANTDRIPSIEAYRRYLLGIAKVDGQKVGIPKLYWTDTK